MKIVIDVPAITMPFEYEHVGDDLIFQTTTGGYVTVTNGCPEGYELHSIVALPRPGQDTQLAINLELIYITEETTCPPRSS